MANINATPSGNLSSSDDSDDDRIQPGMNAKNAIKFFAETAPTKAAEPVRSKTKDLEGFYKDAPVAGVGGAIRPKTMYKPSKKEKSSGGGGNKRQSARSNASRASRASGRSKASAKTEALPDDYDYGFED